jgi:uroporphyrinogen III methyltransferase/synthase
MTTRQTKKESSSVTTSTATAPVAPAPSKRKRPLGHVSFVGAGPGDRSLLTVRAAELLEQADVVITELPEQAALVTNGAEIVEGGVGDDGATLTHAARARLVVKHAKNGAHVVRLVAGDPFTYATAPEEAAACAKAGIGFEVVPGISSVSAVPAYAGVPLTNRTNREYSVVRVGDATIDWSAYVTSDTLVLLSAVKRIGEVAAGLVEAGRSPETPVAMTRVGTTTEQTTVVSTLADIAVDAAAAGRSSRCSGRMLIAIAPSAAAGGVAAPSSTETPAPRSTRSPAAALTRRPVMRLFLPMKLATKALAGLR